MTAFKAYAQTTRARPSTCLADLAELEGRRLSSFDRAMPADYFIRKLPRKWWEWDYISDCADKLGLLTPDAVALGLGAGFEPLIFHFANSCKKVIATDLYSGSTAWSEARFETTQQVMDSAPIKFPKDRVEVRNADMRHTEAPDGSVDVVWSCSSIEHIPTFKDLFLVFAEIDRILKVGGHAILTTEFTVTGNPYLLPGVNAWNQDLFDIIKPALRGFEFVGPTDLSFNALHPGNAARPRRYLPVSSLPAAAPELSYYHRSGSLANPVGLSIIVPIAFVLKKTSNAGVAPWNEVAIPPRLRTYSDGMAAFFDGKNEDALAKLTDVYRNCSDDLQLKHLAFRFLIDAKARLGHMKDKAAFADTIEEFLTHLPGGSVQDADALDICGYLLGETGRPEKALEVYRKCLLSPSTSREHLCELIGRTVELAGKVGRGQQADAIDLAGKLVGDLVQFGLTQVEVAKLITEPLTKKLGRGPTDQILKRARQALDPAVKALAI